MKFKSFSKKIASLVLALFMIAGAVFGVDFLPELKADAATTSDTITDLYHDSAEPFISNIQPIVGEKVTVRMRAVKGNVSSARFYYYNLDTKSSSYVTMAKSSTAYDETGYYEYWEASYTVPDASGVRYWFRATNKSGTLGTSKNYYLTQYADGVYNRVRSSASYDMGWLISPKVQTPEWSHGSTWYSFVPDEFFNGNPSNDDYESDGNLDNAWNVPLRGNLSYRYGGDFEGVLDKIAYIKSLGVNGICFNPVNSANQSVGYGSSNFNQIESTFGNAQTYKNFINFLHDNDLRIIQDVAVYHISNDSIIVNKGDRWVTPGAASGVESPYYSVIVDHELSNGKITTPNWGGSIINHADPTTQALLWSTEEGALVRYANDALGFGVDGYRLDCGGWMIGHDSEGNKVSTIDIMQDIRAAIKSVNEDAVVLSESSGAAQLNAGAWDGEWNLNFLNYTTNIYNGTSTVSSLRGLVLSQLHSFNRQTLLCSHLQLNTHDNQGKHFNNDNKSIITALKLAQMTGVGSPSVYFGEETNYTNGTNYGFTYFNWDESTWNYDVMNFTKALLELRNEYSAVKTGAYIELLTDSTYWHYGRFDENGSVLTVLNSSDAATTYTFSAYKLGIAAGDTLTDWFTGEAYTVNSSGNVTVDVPAGGTIYVSGGKRSSYTAGFNATEITSEETENGKNVGFTVAGTDVTDSYKANGTISVAGNSSAFVKDAVIGKNFTMSGDITFTAAASSTAQANQLGISIGETVIDGKTYKVGAVLRPYISTGSQFILCLTAGVSDSDSKWIGVSGGPTINKGSSNTVNLKLALNNNVLTAYINGTYKAQMDISAYDIEIKPEFFSRCISDPIAFELSNVSLKGDVSTRNSAVSSTNKTVTVTRHDGVISSVADSFMFFNRPAFGAYSYDAYVDSTNGSAAVMIRNTLSNDSAYYAAVLNNGVLTIYARSKAGTVPIVVTTKNTSSATYVKVERDANNTFKTYLGTGTDASVNYVVVDGSAISLGFDERSYVGYTVLEGTAAVRSIGNVVTGENVYSDDFSGTVVKPMLNGILDSSATLGGGKLTLSPGDIITANTPANDWTFKTKLTYTPATENDIAGIVNYQDADTYLVLGRTIRDGKVKLYFGKNSDGKLVTFYMMDDPNPTAEVTLQLQRIGTAYTAVYTYDESTWYSLGGSVFYNLSDENPGIAIFGDTGAAFDYVTFGNAVNDGATYNTPHTPDLENFDLTVGKFTGTYALEALSGTWTDASEGYYQTDSALSHLIIHNKKYEEFRAEATLKLENGAEWVGMNFGREFADSDIGNGYLVKYTSAGTVVLEKNGVVVDTYTLADETVDGGFLRILVECFNGNVYVSIGQKAKIIFEYLNCDYVSGFFSFATNGPARVNNMNVVSMSTEMAKTDAVTYSDAGVQISNYIPAYVISETISGTTYTYYESQYVDKYGVDSSGEATEEAIEAARAKFQQLLDEANATRAENKYFASVRGVASTDFVISANFNFVRKFSSKTTDWDIENNTAITTDNMPNYITDAIQQMGLVLCGSAGMNDVEDGIYVKFTSDGKLYLEKGGVSLCEPYEIPDAPLSIKVMVVKKNGTLSVYLDGGKTPVLTYTEAASNGGTFTFINNNGTVIFDAIMVDDLNPGDDYTTSKVYTDWMSGANLANKGGYFFDDFESSSTTDDHWMTYLGDKWEVSGGTLHTNDNVVSTPWDTGVAYTGGTYSDFILNWKMYQTTSSGWSSVGFRRISPEASHQTNGAYLMFYDTGIARLNNNGILSEEEQAYENSKSSLTAVNVKNGWQSFTLVVQGSTIRLYNEGKLVYHGINTVHREGFVAFKSGNAGVQYDDVEIIPLSTTSAPVVDDTNIADDLEVAANYVDYTSKYQSSKTITVGSYQPVTFPNFAAPENKYNLSATLEKVTTSEGYFETKVGVAEYLGSQYDLVVRINPFVSSAGIYSNATLCLKSSSSTVTLDSWNLDPISTTKTSYELDVAYDDNKLSLWIDNQTAFVDEIDLGELGITLVLPELAFYSTGCGIKISNLAVYGGAEAVAAEPITITDDFTFVNGDNNYTYNYMLGALNLDSQKAFIDNVSVVYLSGISAKFELDSSVYSSSDYNFGFILGTARYNSVTDTVYAVLTQKNKTVDIYHGTTKIYSTSSVSEPEFGDNIFWDDDEVVTDNSDFAARNGFELSVDMTRNNDLTFSVDGVERYTINLSTLKVTNFKATPGFVSNSVEVSVSDVTLSGIGAYTEYDIENVTDSILLDTDNLTYVENGSYTISSATPNVLNNIIFGEEDYYFIGATFSSIPVGAKVGFTIGETVNDTVKVYLSKGETTTSVEVREGEVLFETITVANADSYELVVGHTENGLVSVWVNDALATNSSHFICEKHKFAIYSESANNTVVSGISAWGDLDAKVMVDDTDNGTVKILSANSEQGITVITVKPEPGYQLVAGSLKYIDANGVTRNIIGRYDDANPNEFALYDVGTNVVVQAEFVDTSVTSITTATIGSSLHYFDDTISGISRIDGVRFLTRLYMPIEEFNPQTDVITVNYNGKVYTVEDYGALMIPTTIMDKQGIAYSDLTFENKDQLTALDVSAKNGAIYYNSADYLDFTVVIRIPDTTLTGDSRDAYYNKYYAREYVLRSYGVLRPLGATDSQSDIVIYGESFTDSINNVVERMESEG